MGLPRIYCLGIIGVYVSKSKQKSGSHSSSRLKHFAHFSGMYRNRFAFSHTRISHLFNHCSFAYAKPFSGNTFPAEKNPLTVAGFSSLFSVPNIFCALLHPSPASMRKYLVWENCRSCFHYGWNIYRKSYLKWVQKAPQHQQQTLMCV